ncbi:hypothetical protein MAUB1S_03692 [Mycolicibacterium aubagnense]
MRSSAQQTVDAELARAMRAMATRHLRRHLDAEAAGTMAAEETGPAAAPPASLPRSGTVRLPEHTLRAVEAAVGPENVAAFVAAAAEREVQARTMDALVTSPAPPEPGTASPVRSAVGEPVAVEAVGDALRQMNGGDRLRGPGPCPDAPAPVARLTCPANALRRVRHVR